MSQRKAIYITTPVFPEPNYTQTPNGFFEMIPDMLDSELRVTLVMIRQTFGFHREQFKMGIKKLEEATGMSRNAVKDGAEAAEKRGTFRRTNPDEQGEAEWELVVVHSVTPLTERPLGGQPVTGEGSTSDLQSPIKEIKESKEIEEEEALAKITKAYESEIGVLTSFIADELKDAVDTYELKWILDAIHESAVQNKRSWKYALAILKRWKAQGNQEQIKQNGDKYAGAKRIVQKVADQVYTAADRLIAEQIKAERGLS